MEKVKIKSSHINEKPAKNGNPIIVIELEDGRTVTAFSIDALNWKGEMELDIRKGEIINNKQQYYIPSGKTKKSTSSNNKIIDIRIASLQYAVETAKISEKILNSKDILKVAQEYFKYLSQE